MEYVLRDSIYLQRTTSNKNTDCNQTICVNIKSKAISRYIDCFIAWRQQIPIVIVYYGLSLGTVTQIILFSELFLSAKLVEAYSNLEQKQPLYMMLLHTVQIDLLFKNDQLSPYKLVDYLWNIFSFILFNCVRLLIRI